nr:hypothetical protein [Klebsiella michiganensis]
MVWVPFVRSTASTHPDNKVTFLTIFTRGWSSGPDVNDKQER